MGEEHMKKDEICHINKKQEKILQEVIKNRVEQTFKGSLGTGCHKIIKLTDEKVIFKPCYGKGNITYYFDFTELDDVILYYLLNKNGGVGTHWHLNREISLFPDYMCKELSENEMYEKVKEYLDAFGVSHTSDLLSFLDTHVGNVISVTKRLEKEGLIKIGGDEEPLIGIKKKRSR